VEIQTQEMVVPVSRFVGQPIAAVAATPEAADEAGAIRVQYEVLPHVCNMEAAAQCAACL